MASFFLEKFSKAKSPASTCSLLSILWDLPISTFPERYIDHQFFHPSTLLKPLDPNLTFALLSTSEACLSTQLIKKPYTDPYETSCGQALDTGESQALKLEAGGKKFRIVKSFSTWRYF